MLLTLIYLCVGAFAGLMAGLLGIAGGIITVPALALIFSYLDVPKASLMHLAIGTSLAAMVFNAISSTWTHHHNKAVLWKVVGQMLVGLILGSLFGAFIARLLSSHFLQHFFGVFELLVGIHFLIPSLDLHPDKMHALRGGWLINGIGFGVGFIASILGIGGGLITVPTLMAFRISAQRAIGTSAATGLIISVLGAISYLFFGLSVTHENQTIGYIYLPAFITISIATFFAAPYGARLTHRLPTSLLKKVFGIVLMFAGISMIFLG